MPQRNIPKKAIVTRIENDGIASRRDYRQKHSYLLHDVKGLPCLSALAKALTNCRAIATKMAALETRSLKPVAWGLDTAADEFR